MNQRRDRVHRSGAREEEWGGCRPSIREALDGEAAHSNCRATTGPALRFHALAHIEH
jgi:hypothetical protein